MTQTTFTDNVLIDGSQDTTQLDVQGHSTQNDPLQTWKNSAGDTLAQVTGDGRFAVGDDLGSATPDALIEAHRDSTSTSKPQRGLNTLGRVASALSSAVQWAFAALELVGTGTISSIHSALRAQLTHSSTGNSTAGEFRAGDFEVINESGSSGTRVGKIVGVRAAVTNESAGFVTDAVGLEVAVDDENTSTSPILNAYGIKVNDINDGDNNYALYTGQGTVHFGDQVGIGTIAPDAALRISGTTSGNLKITKTNVSEYPKIDLFGYGGSLGFLNLGRAEGTEASPSALSANLGMGALDFWAHDGTEFGRGSRIISRAAQNWSSAAHGSYLEFQTTPNGSTTPANVLTLGQDKLAIFAGNVQIDGRIAHYVEATIVAASATEVLITPGSGTKAYLAYCWTDVGTGAVTRYALALAFVAVNGDVTIVNILNATHTITTGGTNIRMTNGVAANQSMRGGVIRIM